MIKTLGYTILLALIFPRFMAVADSWSGNKGLLVAANAPDDLIEGLCEKAFYQIAKDRIEQEKRKGGPNIQCMATLESHAFSYNTTGDMEVTLKRAFITQCRIRVHMESANSQGNLSLSPEILSNSFEEEYPKVCSALQSQLAYATGSWVQVEGAASGYNPDAQCINQMCGAATR